MFSPILALLFGLALLHTSTAIKCISQSDFKKAEKMKHFPEGVDYDLFDYFQEFRRVMKQRTKVDCAEEAYNLGEPTHCASIVFASCPGLVKEYANIASYAGGIRELKQCLLDTKEDGNVTVTAENYCHILNVKYGCTGCYVCNESDYCNAGTEKGDWRSIERKNYGRMESYGTMEEKGTIEGKDTTEVTDKPEKRILRIDMIGSTEEEKGTTIGTIREVGTTEGKGTTEVTDKPEENGAGLTTNGAPQALFLLLLAIATGTFRWAAFR